MVAHISRPRSMCRKTSEVLHSLSLMNPPNRRWLLLGVLLCFILVASSCSSPRTSAELLSDLNSDDPQTRLRAAVALAEREDTAALQPLLDFLRSEDGDIRRKAALALGQLGDERAVEPLVIALNDEDWEDRWAAAEAFQSIPDSRAVNPLIAALAIAATSNDHTLTSEACKALVAIGQPSIQPLIDMMVENPPPERRTFTGVHYEAACTLRDIEENTGTIESLEAAIVQEDLHFISHTYLVYVFRHRSISAEEQHVLCEALHAYGNKGMAEWFVNYGDDNPFRKTTQLENCGYEWAEQHGYAVGNSH